MLVSEMSRQEATYFLMNWETRGSEQGLSEECARGLCGCPGSVAGAALLGHSAPGLPPGPTTPTLHPGTTGAPPASITEC